MLASIEDFVPAGTTRGLSGRPLDPFGPVHNESFTS